MDKSKFYLTPGEMNEVHDDVIEECGFADDELIELRLARKAADYAIKTLVEWIEGHGYKQFATDADLHLSHLDHEELLKLEEEL